MRLRCFNSPRFSLDPSVVHIGKNGQTVLDSNGYPEGKVSIESIQQSSFLERLRAPMRVKSGHGGSHTFLTHEFISAIAADRRPSVSVWEAIAYTLPHYGTAPA
ncbi:MAG: hypothetical protein ACKV2U_09010 [Bryobacteraceae bacterium]